MLYLFRALPLLAVLMAGCATHEEAAAPAAPALPGKQTCAKDDDCGDGRICVKPQAADYGFCLG